MHPADQPLVPRALRLPAGVVALLAAAVVAVLGYRYAGDEEAGRVDRRLEWALDAVPGTGRGLARVVTLLGSPPVVATTAVVLAVVCLLAAHRRAAVLVVVGPGLTGLVTTVGKPVVDRVIDGGSLAFPSGHTGGATSLALAAALVLAGILRLRAPGTAVLATACAAGAGGAVGTAMVLIGSHYPTDAVGGFCVAVAVVLVVALVLDATADLSISHVDLRRESLSRRGAVLRGGADPQDTL